MVWRNWESVTWQHCKTYFIYFIYYCAEFWKEYKAQVISQLKLYNLINQWVLIKQHCRLYLKSFITTSSLRHHARPNNYWSIFNDQTQIHLQISFFKFISDQHLEPQITFETDHGGVISINGRQHCSWPLLIQRRSTMVCLFSILPRGTFLFFWLSKS